MPQADLYITGDQRIDAVAALQAVERTILALDPGAGACKGRAHSIADYHHSHMLLSLSTLPKPHRDDAFADTLATNLAAALQPHTAPGASLHIHIRFDLTHYKSLPPREASAIA
ncbi:hypothetical protein [Sphingopyxis sp. MWB1]|uniref:hypothetical protein n=1 Tax=Sphingopyxis sp. MWB1 TaxID=1537715 RepID=UPI00068AAEC5|nr:hypothetical protein [Sphingopyxis sp. MWB1]